MSTLRTLAALAAIAALSLPGCAALKVRQRVSYYRVYGSTAGELSDDMDRVGPLDGQGKRAIATTWWNVRYIYRVKPTATAFCELSSFSAGVDLTMTLPRWQPGPRASKDLRQQWEKFVAHVKEHEDGHAEIGRAAATEVERRVRAVSERQPCDRFKEAIEEVATDTITEYRRKDVQYDRETQHGLTQGAIFPARVNTMLPAVVNVQPPRKQVLVLTSPLLRPHKILGVVRVHTDATAGLGSGPDAADTVKRLQEKAVNIYGIDQVDAILNVLTQMDLGGHVRTTAVAVHFE